MAPIPNVINITSKQLNEVIHSLLNNKAKGNVKGKARSAPSHDFFGLTFFANLCLPNLEPVRYAKVS